MKHFYVVTLFPQIIDSYINESMLKRGQENKLVTYHVHDLRSEGTGKHKQVDDRPYGGGPGMVLQAEPIIAAVNNATKGVKSQDVLVIITSPGGDQLSNGLSHVWLEQYEHVVIIAGRYEGIDNRVGEVLSDNGFNVVYISIGPYVLTGGELPALVMIDSMVRRIPGVLGNTESIEEERTASHEMYTRPETIRHNKKKYNVPEVLLSGNHSDIESYRGDNDA